MEGNRLTSFYEIMEIFAQIFFDGSMTMCGLAAMVMAFFLCIVVLASVKAPPVYAVVPMIPIALLFAGYNIISVDIMVLIILLCSVLVATKVRDVI